MKELIAKYRQGFSKGQTPVTTIHDDGEIAFSILRLLQGETRTFCSTNEWAAVHFDGTVEVELDGQTYANNRTSLFDEQPFTLHVAANTPVSVKAVTDIEMAIIETKNDNQFPSVVYKPHRIVLQEKGKDLAGGAMRSLFRPIIWDVDPERQAKLSIAELIGFPGCWPVFPAEQYASSFLQHFRFTERKGYGHLELGEHLHKIRSFDTVAIPAGTPFAVCTAPGYGIYSLCILRGTPSTVEYAKDHEWVFNPDASFWHPERLLV